MADPAILAFDTSGPWIAAALRAGGKTTIHVTPMARGQAEALFDHLEGLLAEAGLSWPDVGRIAVGTGPGNFTGLRIAVSAARGLAMSLDRAALGVPALEALAQIGAAPAVPAPQARSYRPGADGQIALCDQDAAPIDPEQLILGTLACAAQARAPFAPPRPQYVRPADAAPPSDPPPVILP